MDIRTWSNVNLKGCHAALVLRVDNDIFQAVWESVDVLAEWDLQTDSLCAITGINDAEGSPNPERSTFKLLLRSPADVVPAAAPPFWTRKEPQRIAMAMGGVALLAGAFILLQRWQMCELSAVSLRSHRELARVAALASASEALHSIDSWTRRSTRSSRWTRWGTSPPDVRGRKPSLAGRLPRL